MMPSRMEAEGPLGVLIDALADTEVGRGFGLRSVRSFADFQASVPLMRWRTHDEQVRGRLGFGRGSDPSGNVVPEMVARERGRLLDRWRGRLARLDVQRALPRDVGLLWASPEDSNLYRTRVDDLEALVCGIRPEPLHHCLSAVDGGADPRVVLDAIIDRLGRWRGDTLVVPCLSTCAWIESHIRAPLERHIPSLRWIFAEHELGRRLRSRAPVVNVGWIHPAGRIAVPGQRGRKSTLCLAVDSMHIELLPEGDPLEDPRRKIAPGTIPPAEAILGERYELVLSSARGFLRLRSGEHVRVVGFSGPDTLVPGAAPRPRPRVVRISPPPPDLALEGVTLAGAWLTASVRQAFTPEDPALVAAEIGPDLMLSGQGSPGAARSAQDDLVGEIEHASPFLQSERRNVHARGLFVRAEVQGESDPGIAGRLASRIDGAIQRRSSAYSYLRGRGELVGVRVEIAPRGTDRKERAERLATLARAVQRPSVRVAARGTLP